jgi:hypothetical protein
LTIQPETPRFRNPREREREANTPRPEQSQEVSLTRTPTGTPYMDWQAAQRPVNVGAPGQGTPTPTGVPYQDFSANVSYLQQGESQRFSAEGVEQSKEDQITIEMDKARRAGKPIGREEAERRVGLRGANTAINPYSGDNYISTSQIKSRIPATSIDLREHIAIQYPSISAAAQNAGLTEEEMLKTINILSAHDAASRIVATQNPVRMAQIINTAGPDIQPVIVDILNNWMTKAQEQQKITADQSGGNIVTDVGRNVWAYSLGPFFDGLWWATENTINRVVPTVLYTLAGVDPQDAWNATQKGYIDPSGLEYAREQYGSRPVDISLEFIEAHRSGEPEAIGKIIKKYADANDYEALSVIDQLLTGVVSNDPNIREAAQYVQSMEIGNFGNGVFWSVAALAGIDPFSQSGENVVQSAAYPAIRDASNVVGAFVFDPTLNIGKVGAAYRIARYGIGGLADVDKVDKMFRRTNVQRFWNTFGQSLRYVDEAPDQAIAAQRLNSVRSQYKRWFTPEALDELRKAKIFTADDALEYLKYGDGVATMITGNNPRLNVIVSGQGAKRGSQIVVPHMTRATAEFKRASMVARGWTYDATGAAKIDEVFGAPVSKMIPEEALPFIIKRLTSTGGDKFLGRMMSDFVFAGDSAKRTWMGRFMSNVVRQSGSDTPRVRELKRALLRYGYKREPGVRARAERYSRYMAHMPSFSSIDLSTGKDASKIRDLLLYGGMPKYWADYSAMIWRDMLPSQRMQFATGIGRSVGYSLGIDIVDPVNGRRLIDEMMSGFRAGELYAPDAQDLVSIAGQASRTVKDRLASDPDLAAQIKGLSKEVRSAQSRKKKAIASGLSSDEIKVIDDSIASLKKKISDIRRGAWGDEFNSLKDEAPFLNPSRVSDETIDATKGLYEFQMVNQISLLNFNKLDELSMRQSYLTATLGTNPFMTKAVDYWTLGTLVGPRFQIRNGIEDAILYGTTGGSWKGYRYGQLMSRAKAEATGRRISPKAVKDAEQKGPLSAADLGPVRGQQLGLVPTTTRWLGDKLPKSLGNLVLPHLDSAEISAAATLAAKGDRTALTNLIRKAFMRQKLIFLSRKKNPRVVKDLDEAADAGGFWSAYDEASESSMHLIDGILPGTDKIETTVINGTRVQVHTINREYMSKKVYGSDPDAIRAWYNNLNMALEGDGIKGSKAASMMQRYYQAKRSGDQARVDELVNEFAEWMKVNTPWVENRSGIAVTEGLQSFARRNLDDVLRMFSTKTGGFNRDLMQKIRRVEVDENGVKTFTYRMWDEVDGKVVPRLTENDLVQMKGRPQTVLDSQGIQIPVTDSMPLNNRAWSAMGRSYARLTRQPMFVANYLDARDALRPLEKKLAKELGEEYATRWAVDTATERAFNVLISYVDNPAIRSQMAWNVRNVARFYRAIEDFNRRMVRVTKNNPMAFQKINIAWNVLDDTGFVQEDEFGEKYFIWPGSRTAMQALNGVFNMLGVGGISAPSMPMAFTSNLNMITPSADPDSWWPTFSSPYASLGFGSLMALVPSLSGIQAELFGPYAVGQETWRTILPSNLIRVLETANATFLTDENSRMGLSEGMYASAARAATQSYLAAGLIDPNKRYTEKELANIKSRIDISAVNITAIRTILGPIIPAAFQIKPDTVSTFARDLDLSGMRPAFIQTIKAYDGDISQAYLAWLKMNPGLAIFTVSGNKTGQNIGDYEPFKETVQFIETNNQVVEEFPIGAAFFAPQTGTQNLAAWNYLKAMDAKVPKSVDQYFNEMVTAEGYSMYLKMRGEYRDGLAEGRDKSELDAKWKNAKDWLYSTYPNLEDRIQGSLRTYNTTSKSEYNDVVNEYRGAIEWMESNRGLDQRGKDAKAAIAIYDEARLRLSEMSESDPNYSRNRNDIREKLRNMQAYMESRYPDDRQFDTMLYALANSIPGFGV